MPHDAPARTSLAARVRDGVSSLVRSPEPPDLPRLLPLAMDAAAACAVPLRHWFHRPGTAAGLEEVDHRVETILADRLLSALPCGWRGRTTPPVAARGRPTWVVEPHDGGEDAARGHRGASVSVALLWRGTPVLGAILAYSYPDDSGTLVAWAEGCGPVRRNGRDVRRTTGRGPSPGSVVAVPLVAADLPGDMGRLVAPSRFLPLPGVACGLALAACGEVTGACSTVPSPCRALAGGHALLTGAGLVVRDGKGAEVVFANDAAPDAGSLAAGPEAMVNGLVTTLAGRRGPADDEPGHATYARRPSADALRLDRARGCLLGQFAGDSLGGLVEFEVADDILARYPEGVRLLADGGTWDTLAGQVTDDGEMALSLARSILAAGGYDAGAAFEAYRAWLASRPFDVGTTTRKALSLPFDRAGTATGESKANGSLMRVSPIGVAYAGRPAVAALHAARDGALTHPNPTCVAACRAFAAAVSVGVAGGTRAGMVAAAAGHAGEGEAADGVRAVVAAGEPPADYQTPMGFVLVALGNAFHHLAADAKVANAVVDTVMMGGDTDTNAAVAGALLGAADGMRGIPAQWRRMVTTCRPMRTLGAVRDRPPAYWADDALDLAEALLVVGRR